MKMKYTLRVLDIFFVILAVALLIKPMAVRGFYYTKIQSICQSQEFEYIENEDWGAGIYSDRYILKFDSSYGSHSSLRMNDLAKVYKVVDNYIFDHALFDSELPDIYFEMQDAPYELYIEFRRTSDGRWCMDTCADVYFENWYSLEGFSGMQSITGVVLESDDGLRNAEPEIWEGLEKLDVRVSDKYISQAECDEVVNRFKQAFPESEITITAVDYL